MKKGLILLASLFMMVATFRAMESTKSTGDVADFNPHFYQDEVIEFNERGIKFYVFLDGTFDFNTAPTASVDYIKRGRRSDRHTSPRGVRIEHDYQGRLRRIGNVFINYDHNDRVKRIGSVYIKYRRNKMKKVGNLNIHYDYYGVHFTGSVKYNYYNGSYYTHNPYYSYGWSSFNDWDMWDTWEYSYYDPYLMMIASTKIMKALTKMMIFSTLKVKQKEAKELAKLKLSNVEKHILANVVAKENK